MEEQESEPGNIIFPQRRKKKMTEIDIAKKILELKNKYETMKQNNLRLQGQIESMLEEIKKEYKCNTPLQLKSKIDSTEKQLEEIQINLNGMVRSFQEKYNI